VRGNDKGEWSDDSEDDGRDDGIVSFPNASSSFMAYSNLDLDDSFSATPEKWGSMGTTPRGTPGGRARCEAMACSPIYQNMLSGSPTYGNSLLVGSSIGLPQAHSVPRESSEATAFEDSSEDEMNAGTDDDDGCFEGDEEDPMFVFSPAVERMDEDGLNEMDSIYI